MRAYWSAAIGVGGKRLSRWARLDEFYVWRKVVFTSRASRDKRGALSGLPESEGHFQGHRGPIGGHYNSRTEVHFQCTRNDGRVGVMVIPIVVLVPVQACLADKSFTEAFLPQAFLSVLFATSSTRRVDFYTDFYLDFYSKVLSQIKW